MNQAAAGGQVKALVLSGGGARGAYEAGVVSGLYAKGETFDVICGTSIGAINSALIAQHPSADTLRTVWSSIAKVGVIAERPSVQAAANVLTDLEATQKDPTLKKVGDLFKTLEAAQGLFPLSQFYAMTGGLDPTPVQNFLKTNLNFAQLQLPLIFAATDLTQGSSQVFYSFPSGWAGTAAFTAAEPDAIALTGTSYDEAVRASGAIPIAFPPVPIPGLTGSCAGSYFVDGGVANNTPVGQAVDAGATHITVIFMDPPEEGPDHYPTGNLVQIAAACYAVMAQTILNLDFALALRTNKVAAAGAAPDKREVCLRAIRPAKPLPLTILDFDKQPQIDQAFGLGFADGQNPPPFTT